MFWKSTSGTAHDADDRIISNGNAAGGAVHFATLSGNLALNNADFLIF